MGLGFGAQDVAYLLLSSADFSVLAHGPRLKALITSAYLKPLTSKVGRKHAPKQDDFFRTFRYACLDYAKVVWSYHLADKSPNWVRSAATNIGWCTHNRSLQHTIGIVRFVDQLLSGVDVP